MILKYVQVKSGVIFFSYLSEYSPEMERLLRTENKNLIETWSHLEIEMSEPFHYPDPNKR